MNTTAVELFAPCRVPYGDKYVRGMSIRCGLCGFIQREHLNTVKGHSDNEEATNQMASKKFEAEGWRVGNTAGKHRCPDCIRKARAAQMRFLHSQPKKEGEVNVVELKPPAAEEKPREMTRADRRVIFAKLEDVYGDESTGYKAGWTDQKLAADLAVPVEWIKAVREENFGERATNADVEKVIAEVNAWREEIARLVVAGAGLGERLRKIEAALGIEAG